jgi:hypothetical protein
MKKMSYFFKIIYKTKTSKTDIDYSFEENNDDCTKNKLKILSKEFVNRNKGKYKIIYKNKEFELTDYFDDIDKNYKSNKIIKLKLRVIHNINNFCRMFFNCNKLLSIVDSTKLKIDKAIFKVIKNFYLNYKFLSLHSSSNIKNKNKNIFNKVNLEKKLSI